MRLPEAQGLYNPENEHDNCGIGFVAHIKGKPSHEIISHKLKILLNMDHKEATKTDHSSGDDAGLLIQIPHEFISEFLGINVGDPGKYGTGLVFLPRDKEEAEVCLEVLKRNVEAEGLKFVSYRDVPVDHNAPGEIAKTTEPEIKQIFVKANLEKDALERKLFIIRKLTEKEIRDSNLKYKSYFYQPSFSCKVLVYKGMFTPG